MRAMLKYSKEDHHKLLLRFGLVETDEKRRPKVPFATKETNKKS